MAEYEAKRAEQDNNKCVILLRPMINLYMSITEYEVGKFCIDLT